MIFPKKPLLAARIGASFPFLWYFCRSAEFSQLKTVSERPFFRWFFETQEADLGRAIAYTRYIFSLWPFRLLKQKCLLRSMALYSILKPFRPDIQLVFGVRKTPGIDPLEGHCWLEVQGEPFLDTRENVSRFERIPAHA